jgi:hypothetical protein
MSFDLDFDDFFGGGEVCQSKVGTTNSEKCQETPGRSSKKVIPNSHFDFSNRNRFLSTIKEENESSYCSSYYPGGSQLTPGISKSKGNRMVEEFCSEDFEELISDVEKNLQ